MPTGQISHNHKKAQKDFLLSDLEQKTYQLAKKLGVVLPKSFTVQEDCQYVKNAYWDGKKIAVGSDFLKGYAVTKATMKGLMLEYYQTIDKLPNQFNQLIDALDRLPNKKRLRLKSLSNLYATKISRDELMGIIAHELGHVKLHSKTSQLEKVVTISSKSLSISSNFYLAYRFLTVFFTPQFTLMQSITPKILSSLQLTPFFQTAAKFFESQLSQIKEKEADQVAASLKESCLGVRSYFKRAVIQAHFSGKKWSHNFFNTHPAIHHRLEFFNKHLT